MPTRRPPSSSSSSPSQRRTRRSSHYPSSSDSPSLVKKEPKGKYRQKLHEIVVCDNEKVDSKALKSLRVKKLIDYVRPIGQNAVTVGGVRKVIKQPELQPFGCKVLKGIVDFLELLHKKKFTLKGKLNITMLCWMRTSQTVKLCRKFILKLEKYTEEGAKMDYCSVAASIKEDLFLVKKKKKKEDLFRTEEGAKMDYCSVAASIKEDLFLVKKKKKEDLFRECKLPLDVEAWLDLMADDPVKHRYLIKYNMALLSRKGKMDLFMSLYEKLVQVRRLGHADTTNNRLYYAVVDNIPVGKATPDSVWTSNTSDNKHIKKAYEHQRDRSSSVFGLLNFVRDCIAHLLDYSVENGVAIFGTQDKYLMIETCFKGIFHQFQKAMLDAGFKEN